MKDRDLLIRLTETGLGEQRLVIQYDLKHHLAHQTEVHQVSFAPAKIEAWGPKLLALLEADAFPAVAALMRGGDPADYLPAEGPWAEMGAKS